MHASDNPYEQDLPAGPANHVALSPVSFLARAAHVYPDKVAVIDGDRRIVYADMLRRCRRLASALAALGLGRGDTVSVIAPNVPALLEAHYGVPMCGAVLNALNIRLDAPTIRFILQHAGSRVFIVDRQFSAVAAEALRGLEPAPTVIDIDNPEAASGPALGECEYEEFLARGRDDHPVRPPADEWQAIALNYTSGTTGNPKGVVYHHRGAYLNALGNALAFGLDANTRYLWTLPMFHCNGWTYTWAVTAVGGTHVCLRAVDPALIFPSIQANRVTHLCGAPIVLNLLVNAPESVRQSFDHRIEVATGGAAPPSAIITGMQAMGFHVTHLYGLTETYGPATLCAWQDDWNALDLDQRATLSARQGVLYPTLEEVMVADPDTLQPVPADGATIGEIMIRGNTVMKGYLKNPEATGAALAGGWFHSGDLAVLHPDGYLEVKDRSKDIIISGGENISSLEIEEVLYRHPAVLEAAVVASPDPRWGETPCAFVTPKPGTHPAPAEIIAFCRDHMAHYKAPRRVVFQELPKTSTGKIQKTVLRDRARHLQDDANDTRHAGSGMSPGGRWSFDPCPPRTGAPWFSPWTGRIRGKSPPRPRPPDRRRQA